MNGSSDELSRAYLDSLAIEWRHLNSAAATTECEIFGKKLSTPVMCAGMAHYDKLNPGGAVLFAEGAKAAGTAMFTGMTPDGELDKVIAVGAPAARIIKPFADRDRVLRLIEHDEKSGAAAFAMDIDHVFKKDGSIYDFFGDMLEPQTEETLRLYQSSTSLPFFPKGVLSVHDAEICARAGCKGIIISHHQNMFPWSVPPIKVLPEIKKAVGDSMTVLIDSNLDSGYDVFKALALGADGVFVGRPLRQSFADEGAEGVRKHIARMTDELRCCLARTGSPDIRHIDKNVIVRL